MHISDTFLTEVRLQYILCWFSLNADYIRKTLSSSVQPELSGYHTGKAHSTVVITKDVKEFNISNCKLYWCVTALEKCLATLVSYRDLHFFIHYWEDAMFVISSLNAIIMLWCFYEVLLNFISSWILHICIWDIPHYSASDEKLSPSCSKKVYC